MTTIPQLAAVMQAVLDDFPQTVARSSGFTRRVSKFSATAFVQACVFGWLSNPQATLENLAQTALTLDVPISPQGLDARFTPAAAKLLQEVLAATIRQVVLAEPVVIPLLQRFSAVYLLDSSVITLPDELLQQWAGCGGDGAISALKLVVRLDLARGELNGPELQPGRLHDAKSELALASLPAGALRIADLGFFSLPMMAMIAKQGGYWLSRLHASPDVYHADGRRLDVGQWLHQQRGEQVELPVILGSKDQLPARLLARRVPAAVAEQRRRRLRLEAQKRGQTPSSKQLAWADWTLYVTNVPPEQLSLEEALVMGRARWQIELLFKTWKSDRRVDEWRSAKPWRIMCEVYAKLIGSVMTHWLIVLGSWSHANRSTRKAGQTIQLQALRLASCIKQTERLAEAISTIQRCLARGCRLNKRSRHPNTYQVLLDTTLFALA